MTPDPADLIAAHVAAARGQTDAQPAVVCWRSECRNGCYYPTVCSEKPSPQARFDADGLPRGLMPIAGIRCGEWL
jgi:hypothetical protein